MFHVKHRETETGVNGMLKNFYDDMCMEFNVYYTLNDFINDYKQYYCTKHEQKIDKLSSDIELLTFNDLFSDFINTYLYKWKIGKYENVSLYKYDDNIVVYTKNKCFSYVCRHE